MGATEFEGDGIEAGLFLCSSRFFAEAETLNVQGVRYPFLAILARFVARGAMHCNFCSTGQWFNFNMLPGVVKRGQSVEEGGSPLLNGHVNGHDAKVTAVPVLEAVGEDIGDVMPPSEATTAPSVPSSSGATPKSAFTPVGVSVGSPAVGDSSAPPTGAATSPAVLVSSPTASTVGVTPASEVPEASLPAWHSFKIDEKKLLEIKAHLLNGMNSAQTVAHLGGNNLTDGHIEILKEVLSENGVLRTHPSLAGVSPYATLNGLNLEGNKITVVGAKHVGDILRQNGTLRTIKIGRNRLGAEGAAELAKALGENKTLTQLTLGGNDIGVEGAMAMAEALKKNMALLMFRAGGNNMGNEGAKVFADMLRANRRLSCLHLYGNEISEDGVNSLLEVLQWGNVSIGTLNLGGNLFTPGVGQMNTKLHQVNRLAQVNVHRGFRIRLMCSLMLANNVTGDDRSPLELYQAGGDRPSEDKSQPRPCVWGNLTGQDSGLFRVFLDHGLRRFYNDLLLDEASGRLGAGGQVLPEDQRIIGI